MVVSADNKATGRFARPAIPRVQLQAGLVFQQMGESAVVVSLQTDQIYELNWSGVLLWELLTAQTDRAQLQRKILQEFELNEEQLAHQVEAFVTLLSREGLVSIHAE